MKPFTRPSPRVEALERRDCPALALKFAAGSLFIRGTPTADLTIKANAVTGAFQVLDGTNSFGSYRIGRHLDVRLFSRPGAVNIDLNSKVIPGNVYLDLGNGFLGDALAVESSVDLYDSSAGGGGTVRGGLAVVRGNGAETVQIGVANTGVVDPVAPGPVTVRGNVAVCGRAGLNKTDVFTLYDGSAVGGSVTLNQIDRVTLGSQDAGITTEARVGRDVILNFKGPSSGLQYTLSGYFGRNVTVTAGATATPSANTFTILPADAGAGGDTTVLGKVNVTFGHTQANNLFSILSAAGSTSIISGGVSLTSLNGIGGLPDRVLHQGKILGSLVTRLGSGDNEFSFESGALVNGDLTYIGGNDSNTIGQNGTFTNSFEGTLGGDLTIRVGNGTNLTTIATAVNGIFTYRGGSGSDSVTIAPAADDNYFYTLDLLFGVGTNVLELDATAVVGPNEMSVTGVVEAAVGASNTFTQTDPNSTLVLLSTFRQINFP